MVDHGLVSEARSDAVGLRLRLPGTDAGNIEILHLHGTKEQKEPYLKPLVPAISAAVSGMTEVIPPARIRCC
jgi:hypothetical protein